MNFEEYLMEQFIRNNSQVLDDDIPDAFNDWKENADIEDIIEYAERWNKDILVNQKQDIEKIIEEAVKQTEREHKSPNIYIDMVGELFGELLDNYFKRVN